MVSERAKFGSSFSVTGVSSVADSTTVASSNFREFICSTFHTAIAAQERVTDRASHRERINLPRIASLTCVELRRQLTSLGSPPSYVELLTCLEMATDASTMSEETASNGDQMQR
jgi:uncharacterized lipoprotein YbaY